MAGLWLCDADDGIRELYAELAPHGELLTPEELVQRLDAGERPTGLLVDSALFDGLAPDVVALILGLPRVAVCTGRPAELDELLGSTARPRIVEKPFELEAFDRTLAWLTEESAAETSATA
ncbi:MAG TPA: hypothetical protein VFN14_04695 [Candidatus Limnocylindria bacterium]|nr:hypothetical protein [Candidatus Limnocylindria bacterium]